MGNDEFRSRIAKIFTNFNPRSRVGNDGRGNEGDGNIYTISIHVPAWGTTPTIDTPPQIERFQSTFPRGERHECCAASFVIFISIHVPAWGTTTLSRYALPVLKQFQSTFPRGERRCYIDISRVKLENFNPRSRVGNDLNVSQVLTDVVISIHVPAWGTTKDFT